MLGYAAGNKGINPKIILATLQWEQSWENNGNYNTLFGVYYDANDPVGSVENCAGIYTGLLSWRIIR